LSDSAAREIKEILRAPLDWELLLSQAAENAVTPLLDRQLRAAAPDSLPPQIRECLHSALRANSARNLFLTVELTKVLNALRSAGVPAFTYKGPALAAQAYGDVTLREFDDVDVVLPQRHMPKAHEVMTVLGYRAKFEGPVALYPGAALIPGEYSYRDAGRHVIVELHTEYTLRHFPVRPDIDDLERRSTVIAVAGQEVRTLSAEDNIPLLCIHGAKDFWGRLSWIADVSEMVQAHPGLDWNAVTQRSEAYQAGRMLHLGLRLAADLLGMPLPDEIGRRVRSDGGAAIAAGQVERMLLDRGAPEPNGPSRFRFRRRMLPGYLAGWRYATRLALMPAEEDWSSMRLAGPLAPLYPLLRPLRLLRKYGFFGRRANNSALK
jgi:hypothetical protein